MTVPDCRDDINYNYDFLNQFNKEYVNGFDMGLSIVSDALDEIANDDSFSDEAKNALKAIKEYVADKHESYRDELITGMIDNMDESEYQAIRHKVMAENKNRKEPKNYYDTRCLYKNTAGANNIKEEEND